MEPRPRRMSVGILVALILGASFTGVCVVFGLLFVLIGGPPWDDWILDARGGLQTAVAVDVPTDTERPGSLFERWHRVAVMWPGAPHPVEVWMPEHLVEPARRGEPMMLEVDPHNLDRARIAGERASFFGGFFAIPAGFGVAGVPLLGLGAVLFLRRATFVRNAQVTRAEVAEVVLLGGKGSTQRVTVAFTGPSGPTTGSCLHNPEVRPGDAVWVACDRRAPTRCEILGPAL